MGWSLNLRMKQTKKQQKISLTTMVRLERKKRRITQDKIAAQAGISHQTYVQFEVGRRNIGYKALMEVFNILEIEVTPKSSEE